MTLREMEAEAERLLRHVATDRLPVDSGAVAKMLGLIRDAHEAGRQGAVRESDHRWNDAIDWLLNSRHTGDPDIQAAFWGIADGKLTREQADSGAFELDADGEPTPRVDED